MKRAEKAGRELIDRGFTPFVPHLHPLEDSAFDVAMDCDLPWVRASDALLRLSGESVGADTEVELAKRLGIPVFYSVEEIVEAEVFVGDEEFEDELDALFRLYSRKQRDYGRENDPYANVNSSQEWGIEPWLAAMVRSNDKVKRLQKFSRTRALANESVLDSFDDLAVYAMIAKVLFRRQSA